MTIIVFCLFISLTGFILKANAQPYHNIPNKPPLIQKHKYNYALLYSISDKATDPEFTDDRELKYQISFKTPIFHNHKKYGWLFFAYTQKSFWQVYDPGNSRPFRETNYNPEIFYQYRNAWKNQFDYGFDLGFEHESNGQVNDRSRSWDRSYLSVLIRKNAAIKVDATSFYEIDYKIWHRKQDEEDENPGIESFYGNTELTFRVGFRRLIFSLMRRVRASGNEDGSQLEIIYTLSDSLGILVQYWNGYGESLERYNLNTTRWGVGFTLTPE